MRYERRKEFTALLSMSSVGLALMTGFLANFFAGDVSDSITAITVLATALAAVAASMSILITRRFERERERRRVFLIYAREDIEVARRLAADLKESGFRPWLDVDEIVPGQIWQKAVLKALEESAVALVLVSKNLAKKGFVQEELKVALESLQERDKEISPIVPVKLDDSEVPEQLAHIQWVNLNEEGGLERLLSGLSRVADPA